MTSWTYMTNIFVFVFLIAIDLSKGGCIDYLNKNEWANLKNLNDAFTLVIPEDLKDTVKCTLEAECRLKGHGIGCNLLDHCTERKTGPRLNVTSPECERIISSHSVHIYHFMCLMAKAFKHPLEGCEYNTVCKIYPEKYYPSDLTTTPTTTTTLTTTTPTTTTLSTTTPTTTTLSTTTPTTTLPETTTTTVLPLPTTATITTWKPTATKLAPEPSVANVGNNETLSSEMKQEPTDKLKMLLGLSLVFNVIVPLAVYLYMRHRWMRDRMPSNLTCMSNGNLTGDPPKTEADAPPAFRDAENAECTHLMKRDKHPDVAILNCFVLKTQCSVKGPTHDVASACP